MTEIKTGVAELDAVRLHYVEAAGAEPPLLLIHGATGSHTTYLPFLPTLAQHARVYAVDLRGHGLSGRTPGAYRLADYGRDVASFLRTVVVRPAILAGHSLGGYVALWVAAEEPDLIERVFLEDPPLYLTELSRLRETVFYQFFTMLRNDLPAHHARGGTIADLVGYVGQMPFDEQQTMLDVAGPAWVQERAEQLHHLDPDMLEIWRGDECPRCGASGGAFGTLRTYGLRWRRPRNPRRTAGSICAGVDPIHHCGQRRSTLKLVVGATGTLGAACLGDLRDIHRYGRPAGPIRS